MKCPNCESENSDSAKFCKKCGNPLEKTTINHENMINSISGNDESRGNNTTKIIIIALVIVAVVLAGAFVYMYTTGNSSTNSNSNNAEADQNTAQVDDSPSTSTAQSSSSQPAKSTMKIKSGSFSTGSADADKTYAQIYVGTEHAGEDVIVQIFYSRNGNSLNHGNMVPASVHSDGYLYITSADAYKYYPDYATIKLYDSNSNLIDTHSVSLSPKSGTQTF